MYTYILPGAQLGGGWGGWGFGGGLKKKNVREKQYNQLLE